jgi:hypothetical protein
MSAYLDIAEQVLTARKRPLAAKVILDAAYRDGLVPDHLYGVTQHKTLQARISEDILEFREQSRFFRTEPGKFFLTKFLADASIPQQFRQPVIARRRVRQLMPRTALAVAAKHLKSFARLQGPITPERLNTALLNSSGHPTKLSKSSELVYVWSFAIVRRGSLVLTYRTGKYREDRDSFLFRRSLGFSAMVEPSDQTLFNHLSFGIPERGLEAAKTDLEIFGTYLEDSHTDFQTEVQYFVYSEADHALIGVVYYECPEWFEPTKRRLSMHDVQWHEIKKSINNIEDFDPWSQLVLKAEIATA